MRLQKDNCLNNPNEVSDLLHRADTAKTYKTTVWNDMSFALKSYYTCMVVNSIPRSTKCWIKYFLTLFDLHFLTEVRRPLEALKHHNRGMYIAICSSLPINMLQDKWHDELIILLIKTIVRRYQKNTNPISRASSSRKGKKK